MKTHFFEYYSKSPTELNALWDNAIFVFDTNVLLDLYRFPQDTSDVLLKAIKKLKELNQLWLPHQIGLEFHNRRREIIHQQRDAYNKIQKSFTTEIDEYITKAFERACTQHLLIHKDEYSKNIKIILRSAKKIANKVKKLEKIHPSWENDDKILKEITDIFEGVMGDPFSAEKYQSVIKDGDEKYKNKIPPGYMDDRKDEAHRFGDLILWSQILEKNIIAQKPIIFITRDQKEDWWWTEYGKIIGPRRELVREMKNTTNMDFHMYNTIKFIEFAREKFSIKVNKNTKSEIEKISNINDKNNNFYNFWKFDTAENTQQAFILDDSDLVKINSDYIINENLEYNSNVIDNAVGTVSNKYFIPIKEKYTMKDTDNHFSDLTSSSDKNVGSSSVTSKVTDTDDNNT